MFTMNKHLVPEYLMELSEVHWKNMFYSYIYTDSSSLVNVSPMRIALAYLFLLRAAYTAL